MKKMVSVVGRGDEPMNSEAWKIAEKIGFLLIESGFRLVCGGLGGVMKAACKGAAEAPGHIDGDIVGILPGDSFSDANEFVDIPLCAGTGYGRNIAVASSHAVIAVGGGAGTLSEIAMTWQLKRLVLAWDGNGEGWSGKVAGRRLDSRSRFSDCMDDKIFGFKTAGEAMSLLLAKLKEYS